MMFSTVPEYGRVVIRSTRPRDTLLSLDHLHAICRLDEMLRSPPELGQVCETWRPGRCCPSWSLPNYVALISNRSSCHNITVSVCASSKDHCSFIVDGCYSFCGSQGQISWFVEERTWGDRTFVSGSTVLYSLVYKFFHLACILIFTSLSSFLCEATDLGIWSQLRFDHHVICSSPLCSHPNP